MTRPKIRDERLDIARGAAIVAIVVVHVFRGLRDAGLIDSGAARVVELVVGPWCLSVFAFVGGAFVPRAVQRIGVTPYLRERVGRLFAIYITWTAIQGGIQLIAASAVNTPPSVGALFVVWRPIGQLWYLPFLILLTVVFVPLKPWMATRAPWVLFSTAGISVVFWGYDGGYVGTQGLALVLFFVAGMVIGRDRALAALDRLPRRRAALFGAAALGAATAVSLMGLATPPTNDYDTRDASSIALGLVVAVATSVAILLLAHALRAWGLPARLGRHSLEIYLAHIVMASGTRIVLVHSGITSAWVLVAVCTAVGVAGPLIAAAVLRRAKLGWVFDGPQWLLHARASAPAHHPARARPSRWLRRRNGAVASRASDERIPVSR